MLSKNKIFLLVGGLVVLAVITFSPIPKLLALTVSTAVDKYAWSDGMGWIGMSPKAVGDVSVDSSGNFSGYAWGDNIGWINMAGVSVPVNIDGNPVPNSSVTGTAQACSVLSNGCVLPFRASDQTGGWDGKITMKNVTVSADGKSLTGYAWSDLNTMWVNMSLLKFTLGANYTLSVHQEAGDTTGVTSVIPVGINETKTYTAVTPMVLTARNNLGVNQPTCWRGCATTITADAKSDKYNCLVDSNKDVFVGCGNGGDHTVTGGGVGGGVSGTCSGSDISGLGTYASGDTVTLSIPGFIAIWSGIPSGCSVPGIETCSFTMPPQNVVVSASGCTDVPPSDITDVTIKTGAYQGIVFSKQGGSPYPWASQPFTVTVTPRDAIFDIDFDWNNTSIPAECITSNNIRIIADSGSYSCVNAPSVAIKSNDTYRLCFANRCAGTDGYSRLNKTWTVNLTGVNGKTTKLKYSDATHQ
ncbi:MAG: hypothetical protein A2556_00235 [Candidatus Vogelbacteria bacterium RIFOXYD2_FULL_44_9]|uniref:Uncharacterized protein n=1 Tax=Candidatus Vogelbacteria bacterium RIFOXYD2_FULL_44_9 TaxID=1802441 RepID=A0A1G2QKV0_9BACT|nr:MAG: hypothetical protein A2556_00235 [Candidatus Vogelbacteria bacterium RIFOXYD2_FULL_44_9]